MVPDDIEIGLPKNTLQMNCGCLLYVNSFKNHGVTIHCKDHRTKAEIENDEEGLIVKLSWQTDEIERLRADRDRWRKIALWNLEIAGYDNPEEHVRLCYYEDGTYHGGAR